MRVAALYDIHGNIDALVAVLDEVDTEKVDLVVIGGDIAWGAFPSEAIDRVLDLGESALVIRGNADRDLVTPPAAEATSWIDEVTQWCDAQLRPHQRDFLSSLPLTKLVNVGGLGEAIFCHATPRSDDEIFTAITPDEEVAAILADVREHLVICGHTHTQFDRRAGGSRIVNVGSVGMPYQDEPGAYWALLGEDIEMRRTDYDFESAADRIRESGCPHADGFADGVTSPLSGMEATHNFETMRQKLSE